MKQVRSLLWDALLLGPGDAWDVWRKWRASANLNSLNDADYHMLCALAGRVPVWLDDDPQRAIILGVCRRAWSHRQMQRNLLARALAVLDGAGIEPVAATGPVIWGDLYWPDGAARPIGSVDVLIRPKSVPAAFEALGRAGWKGEAAAPDTTTKAFPFMAGAAFQSPSGAKLVLHWRALSNTDLSLRRPEFPPLEPAPAGLIARCAIPAEYALVAALSRRHQDGVAWQFDALMICRQPGLRWDVVKDLLRWRSAQREKLATLRSEWGANVPAEVTKPAPTQGLERILASALRTYRRARRGAGRPSAVRP